jgi:transposase
MAKYSYEFKKEIVNAYMNNEGGIKFLGNKYGVKSYRNILTWVNNFKSFGDKGLMRSRKKEEYTFEFKLHVVELYLTTEVSYQELALSVGINNPPLITKWVNDFRIAGPDALRAKSKGRKKSMNRFKNSPTNEHFTVESVDTSAEHIKQLEDELLKLRIENAYLKELRRLRLEEEALLKKRRDSSTTSEENSN